MLEKAIGWVNHYVKNVEQGWKKDREMLIEKEWQNVTQGIRTKRMFIKPNLTRKSKAGIFSFYSSQGVKLAGPREL